MEVIPVLLDLPLRLDRSAVAVVVEIALFVSAHEENALDICIEEGIDDVIDELGSSAC